MKERKDTYIIHTASDPIACSLGEYLEDKNFIVPAHSVLGESATLLVFLTSKRALVKAIKDFMRREEITGMVAKAIKIARVPYGTSVTSILYSY